MRISVAIYRLICYNKSRKQAQKRGKIVQKTNGRKSMRNVVQIALILAFCAVTVALDFICCARFNGSLQKTMICKLVQQLCGATAAILLMIRLNVRLFGKPQKWLYLIPCMIVAIDNFQFSAYFNGRMELIHDTPTDMFLFGGYCLSVGLFEECIFRGVIFSVLADIFPQNKKGFLLTYVVSSVAFGFMHILNGFFVGTLLQIGYSVLTGGLFAFCLIKTKNIICCAIVHGLYNFCGMLFGAFSAEGCVIGLGNGVVFDTGTVITMLIVSVLVGIFVVYKIITYSEQERLDLYEKLGVNREKAEEGAQSITQEQSDNQ